MFRCVFYSQVAQPTQNNKKRIMAKAYHPKEFQENMKFLDPSSLSLYHPWRYTTQEEERKKNG